MCVIHHVVSKSLHLHKNFIKKFAVIPVPVSISQDADTALCLSENTLRQRCRTFGAWKVGLFVFTSPQQIVSTKNNRKFSQGQQEVDYWVFDTIADEAAVVVLT